MYLRLAAVLMDDLLGLRTVSQGAVRVSNNARLYLVQDHRVSTWNDHKYVRLDLRKQTERLDGFNNPRSRLETVEAAKGLRHLIVDRGIITENVDD